VLLLLPPSLAYAADPGRDALRRHVEHLFADGVRQRAHAPVRPPILRSPTGDYDLLSIDLDADLRTDTGRVVSTVRMTLRSQTVSLRQARFLVQGLEVVSVADASGPLAFDAEPYSGLLAVTLRTPLPLGSEATFTVVLRGTPPCADYCALGEPFTYLALTDLVPLDIDAVDGHWDDPFAATYAVTLPAGRPLLASGRAAGVETLPDGRERSRFHLASPSLYQAFASAPYVVASSTTTAPGLIPLRFAALAGHDGGSADWLRIMGEAVRIDADSYGPFPFDHFDAVEVPSMGEASAVSFTSLVWYGEPHLADPRAVYGSTVLAHEIGHQWWGNGCIVGEPNAPWLMEGFAEFSAIHFLDRAEGPPRRHTPRETAAFRTLHGDIYTYLPLWTGDDSPLSSPEIYLVDDAAYVIVTYMKGAAVVEALRNRVGEEAFFAALRSLFSGCADNPITTERLQAAMEAASPRDDLDRFFSAWVYDTGFPTIDTGAHLTGSSARVRVRSDDPRFDGTMVFFRAEGPGGTCREVGRSLESTMAVTLMCDTPPARVRIDPDGRFPRRLRPELEGDLELSGDVDGFDLVAAAWSRGINLTDYSPRWNALADVNEDGFIDDADLDAVRSHFGEGTAPIP
jgi:aminopeptidase N